VKVQVHAGGFAIALSLLAATLSLACDDSAALRANPAQTPSTSKPGESSGASGMPSPGGGSGGMNATPGETPMADAHIWFAEDFESGSTGNWDLTPGAGASFSVVTEPGGSNHVLQYTAGSSTDNLVALLSDNAWAQTEARAGSTPLADYYVQARVKPQVNGTTGNKQLFLVARYQDAGDWYLGGLNVQNDPAATQVEAGFRKASSITRAVQGRREIVQGTQGQADGSWYTLRLELIGSALSMYLDGERIGSTMDSEFTSGKIGLFTANKSFLIDDIVVGDPALKPVSLVLSPPTLLRTVEAETPPLQVVVQALTSDGVTPDSFSAVSDNEAVLTVTIAGTTVSLNPLTAGVAHVTFTSGSDPSLSKVVTLTVTPAYRDPPGVVAGLAAAADPAPAATLVPVDSTLRLRFDAPPTLGTGSVRIFRASDGSLADSISLGAESDVLGPPMGTSGGRIRQVNTRPIRVDGNDVLIQPHHRVLEYGTSYTVGVADGAIVGTLGGVAFAGVGSQANWGFATRATAPTAADVTVDDNGNTADFRTIQAALDHVMQNVAVDAPATISVANGNYHELLYERGKNNLTIRGESKDGVVVDYENFEGFNAGTGASVMARGTSAAGGRSLFLAEGSDLLTLDNFTIRNTHRRTGAGDQAETIYFNVDQGRLVATNMQFSSEQDTLQLHGFSWFFNTLIEGNVDFIWGNNHVALFENSEVRTVGDSRNTTASGGYVVQARTVAVTDKGFVFLNSSLTQGAGPAGTLTAAGATYLARSGGNPANFDNVAVINCKLDTHIAALGWAEAGVNGQPAPTPATGTADSGWREFGSTDLAGAPLSLAARSAAAHILTAQEVADGYTNRAQIFSAFNGGAGWNPTAP
jgi:pectate lyase